MSFGKEKMWIRYLAKNECQRYPIRSKRIFVTFLDLQSIDDKEKRVSLCNVKKAAYI